MIKPTKPCNHYSPNPALVGYFEADCANCLYPKDKHTKVVIVKLSEDSDELAGEDDIDGDYLNNTGV
jgi:hypothetical protein